MNGNRTVAGYTAPPSRPRTFSTYHDVNGSAKLSTTIVHALADVMDVNVSDVDFSLYDSIDVDALDDLFTPAGEDDYPMNGHLSFVVEAYEVTVYSDGQITISQFQRQNNGQW